MMHPWLKAVVAAALSVAISSTLHAQTNQTDVSAVPAGLTNAKSAFVSNGGSDAGLFPEPFSGDPNRPYFQLFKSLKAAHFFDLADAPSEADLIIEIHLSAPLGTLHSAKQLGSADALPFFKLTIYDGKTHFILWTITEPIEIAYLQKTHDKNFDQALAHVVDDLGVLQKPGSGSLYPHPPARQSEWR